MIALRKEEKKIYDSLKKYTIGNLSKTYKHVLSFFTDLFINEEFKQGLVKLVKDQNTNFLCDMYMDYMVFNTLIDYVTATNGERLKLVNKYFHIDRDDKESIDIVNNFCYYLLCYYDKKKLGYVKRFSSSTYYFENWKNEKNIEIFKLKDIIEDNLAGVLAFEDNEYEALYNKSLVKLMGHIILHNELFNEEVYRPLIESFATNYSSLYDNYLIKKGKEPIQDFFKPAEFIELYKNGFVLNKKEIK